MSMSDGTKVNSNSPPPNAKLKQKKKKARSKKNRKSPKSQSSPLSSPLSAPTAQTQSFKVTEPKMWSTKKGVTVVAHRELLGSINSNNNQNGWAILNGTSLGLGGSGVFRMNAGSESTNPWLAQVAKNFEFYKFRKFCFHYLTRCATTQVGSVMITPEYDAEDQNPASEQQAAMSVDTKEFSPWASIPVPLKTEKMNALYKAHTVMSDSRFNTTSQDTKTVDVGKVILSADISGTTPPVPLGKLWVEYECELTVPQSPATTTAVSLNVNGVQLNTTVANVFTSTALNSIQQNLNPKNPIFTSVPSSASANLGTLAKNGAYSLLIDLAGMGLTGGLPNISLQNPNTGSSTTVMPAAQVANGAGTGLTGRWEIPPTLGQAGNIIGMFPIFGAAGTVLANLKLLNSDPVPYGFPPIIDL